METSDRRFDGSIPAIYERDLVPLIFQPYADDLAARVAALEPGHVLELAAGTGVVTRALAARLPASTTVVATDLNPAMLDHARALIANPRVSWRQADAMTLPFDDGAFDAVVCQFGGCSSRTRRAPSPKPGACSDAVAASSSTSGTASRRTKRPKR